MISRSAQLPRATGPSTTAWIMFALCLAVCGSAITGRSFWIDEIETARIAQQPSLAAAWREVFRINGSDAQMPFNILWVWLCGHVVGTSELALRAVNTFWFIPGVMTFALAVTKRPARWVLFAVTAASPLLWYYLNEARSYSMQAGESLFLFGVLTHWWLNQEIPIHKERWRAAGFALALVLLGGSSMLGMIFTVTPLLMAAVLLPPKRLQEFGRTFLPFWMTTLILFFLTGVYYLWTLHKGARATAIAGTNWSNLAFISYELFGGDGLGPGRSEIREQGLRVFRPYASQLVFYGVTVLVFIAVAIREIRQKLGGKKLFWLAVAVGLPAAFILTAGAVLKFRVLGRHFSPLLPVVLGILAIGILTVWRRGVAGKILVSIFFALYLTSALSLRLAARHEKDNYRAAAALAKKTAAAGKTVWWNAMRNGAIYYHVPMTDRAESQPGVNMIPYPGHDPLPTNQPDLILTTRPDVLDVEGVMAAYLKREHFQPTTNIKGFILWQKPADAEK